MAFSNIRDHGKLFLTEVAFDTLFTGKFAMLLHERGLWLSRAQTVLMHTLVAHLALKIVSCVIGWLLALLASPAQEAMPNEAFDQICVQIHAFTVDHSVTLRALKRVICLSHVDYALHANLALFGVAEQWHDVG